MEFPGFRNLDDGGVSFSMADLLDPNDYPALNLVGADALDDNKHDEVNHIPPDLDLHLDWDEATEDLLKFTDLMDQKIKQKETNGEKEPEPEKSLDYPEREPFYMMENYMVPDAMPENFMCSPHSSPTRDMMRMVNPESLFQQEDEMVARDPLKDAKCGDVFLGSNSVVNRGGRTLSECAENLTKDITELAGCPAVKPHTPAAEDIYSSTLSCSPLPPSSSPKNFSQVKAGRSLLRRSVLSSNPPKPESASLSASSVNNHNLISFLEDHSYFAGYEDLVMKLPPRSDRSAEVVTPSSDVGSDAGGASVLLQSLTPNDSGDETFGANTEKARRSRLKASAANERLKLKNDSKSRTNTFHQDKLMSYDSSGDDDDELIVEVHSPKIEEEAPRLQPESLLVKNRPPVKRKSAIKNTHCPSQPSPKKARYNPPATPVPSIKIQQRKGTLRTISVITPPQVPSQQPRQPARTTKRQSQGAEDPKSKEVRNLHNSMERQRRVDLRRNFLHLKDVVPEIRRLEKASKLIILNKSSDYCKELIDMEDSLKKQYEESVNIRASLTSRLQSLVNEPRFRNTVYPNISTFALSN